MFLPWTKSYLKWNLQFPSEVSSEGVDWGPSASIWNVKLAQSIFFAFNALWPTTLRTFWIDLNVKFAQSLFMFKTLLPTMLRTFQIDLKCKVCSFSLFDVQDSLTDYVEDLPYQLEMQSLLRQSSIQNSLTNHVEDFPDWLEMRSSLSQSFLDSRLFDLPYWLEMQSSLSQPFLRSRLFENRWDNKGVHAGWGNFTQNVKILHRVGKFCTRCGKLAKGVKISHFLLIFYTCAKNSDK